MSRYIDADALLKKYHDTFVDDINIERNSYWDSVTVRKIVDEMPTADVVEVVHGENISKGGFLCSVCKFGDFNGFHGYEPNFCPNCGADMRGGTDEQIH